MELKLLLLSMSLLSIIIPVFAQGSLLTVETSEATYKEGDTIVISGKITAIIAHTPVLIQVIYGEENIINVAQLTPADDGSFTHTIKAQGNNWKNDGEYVVRVSYGTNNVSESSFNFLTKQNTSQIENNFEVEIPDSASTFDVEYTIRGGTIKDMIIDNKRFSLITIIESTGDGTLTIQLPRNEIDAKTGGCEGEDDVYIIFIDGIEVPYQEIDDTSEDRVISIEFEEGDSEVEIIGTCVVPEFGSIVIIVLAIAIISTIVVSRKSILKI